MSVMVATSLVSKTFKSGSESVQALKEVSIEVKEQTLVVLRGRSGSGKTTLMNIIGALDYPTNGKVTFHEREISNLKESQRDKIRRTEMGFIFQSFALIPFMSAFENIEFALQIAGLPAKLRKDRTKEVLSFVGLSGRANHRPYELSGGEQQRVAIARAIAHRPKLLLADEPTAEVDSKMAFQIMKVFRDLVEKEPVTIIMTTHDPAIMEVADNVFTLEDGKIV